MRTIIEDSEKDHFANRQSSRDLQVTSDASELDTQLMDSIDNIGDFVRFVDRSSKAEISSRGFTRAAALNPRRADTHPNRHRRNSARSLTLILGLARYAKAD